MMRPALLLLITTLAGAQSPPLRVLFIGNSLTEANGLPSIAEDLAKANGQRIETRTVVYPGYSLEDHWNQGDAKRAITGGNWSFVVLQQGPSSLPESRVLLIDYARRFSAEAARAGAKTALYMVWPSTVRARDFDGVELTYQTAARELGALLLPAGTAWRLAWRQDATLKLYGEDGFHPSPLGSYLAALVIYQGLTGRSPRPSASATAILLSAASQALKTANP
jgi:hypothetical protein